MNLCSVEHNPKSLKNLKTYGKYPFKISCDDNTVKMEIKEIEPIAFTYEVTFIESDIKWPSRWNTYMKIEVQKVKRYLTHHEDTQFHMIEEYSNSKLVVPDILHAPSNPTLFCVMVGNGVQIIGKMVVTIAFSALGFTTPASCSALVTRMLISYMFLGISVTEIL
ncbi:hypothetical protein L2E82_45793 [Cichorium intybus]|uniref:Uncharacterized protein n=1 Tax=Cichorium intybus TaxID=13427 RepID=A0ACB8ZVA8_CICIN|nr:hypothetical protein L2E82_45793 [Cichorium intybus]